MLRLLSIVFICLLLASCVSNNPYKTIKIYSERPTSVVYKTDSVSTKKYGHTSLVIPKTKENLALIVKTDTIEKQIQIPSNTRKIVFNKKLEIEKNIETQSMYYDKRLGRKFFVYRPDSKYTMGRKGDIFLNFSLPVFNWFSRDIEQFGRTKKFGYIGISTGLDYFYQNNKYVSLTASWSTDFNGLIPIYEESDSEHEGFSTSYLTLSNNHVIRNFSLGYGLSYSQNAWEYTNSFGYYNSGMYWMYYNNISRREVNTTLGLTFNTYYHYKGCYIGLLYRPSFYQIEPIRKYKYEHIFSIDIGFKVRLLKGKGTKN